MNGSQELAGNPAEQIALDAAEIGLSEESLPAVRESQRGKSHGGHNALCV